MCNQYNEKNYICTGFVFTQIKYTFDYKCTDGCRLRILVTISERVTAGIALATPQRAIVSRSLAISKHVKQVMYNKDGLHSWL